MRVPFRMQHLHGDVAAESDVMTAQHRSHAADADQAVDAIAIRDDFADESPEVHERNRRRFVEGRSVGWAGERAHVEAVVNGD